MIATGERYSSSGTDGPGLFTIEQVAARTGLTKRTLRYYEEVGLLLPADRTEANYRRYSEEDIQHLERIKNLRDLLGFSLADIRKLLEGAYSRPAPPDRTETDWPRANACWASGNTRAAPA